MSQPDGKNGNAGMQTFSEWKKRILAKTAPSTKPTSEPEVTAADPKPSGGNAPPAKNSPKQGVVIISKGSRQDSSHTAPTIKIPRTIVPHTTPLASQTKQTVSGSPTSSDMKSDDGSLPPTESNLLPQNKQAPAPIPNADSLKKAKTDARKEAPAINRHPQRWPIAAIASVVLLATGLVCMIIANARFLVEREETAERHGILTSRLADAKSTIASLRQDNVNLQDKLQVSSKEKDKLQRDMALQEEELRSLRLQLEQSKQAQNTMGHGTERSGQASATRTRSESSTTRGNNGNIFESLHVVDGDAGRIRRETIVPKGATRLRIIPLINGKETTGEIVFGSSGSTFELPNTFKLKSGSTFPSYTVKSKRMWRTHSATMPALEIDWTGTKTIEIELAK